jgi:hypothetical protein
MLDPYPSRLMVFDQRIASTEMDPDFVPRISPVWRYLALVNLIKGGLAFDQRPANAMAAKSSTMSEIDEAWGMLCLAY